MYYIYTISPCLKEIVVHVWARSIHQEPGRASSTGLCIILSDKVNVGNSVYIDICVYIYIYTYMDMYIIFYLYIDMRIYIFNCLYIDMYKY